MNNKIIYNCKNNSQRWKIIIVIHKFGLLCLLLLLLLGLIKSAVLRLLIFLHHKKILLWHLFTKIFTLRWLFSLILHHLKLLLHHHHLLHHLWIHHLWIHHIRIHSILIHSILIHLIWIHHKLLWLILSFFFKIFIKLPISPYYDSYNSHALY